MVERKRSRPREEEEDSESVKSIMPGDIQISMVESEKLLNELSQNLKIDKHDLDGELVRQPELYHECGAQYQDAVANREKYKNNREEIKGRLDMEIRRRNVQEEKKMTETGIANEISADTQYRHAQELYTNWDRLAAKWASLREDYHARGFSIRDLSALWIAGYYQSNSVTRDVRDRRADEVRRQREEMPGQDQYRHRD